MSSQPAYPDYLSDNQKALANSLLSQVPRPQPFIDIAVWAEKNGGKDKFLDVLAWVTYEYNLMSPDHSDDRQYMQFWISEWISGNPMANRPEWASDHDGEYEFSFPAQTSRCEQWQALHKLREIVIVDLAINSQTLLDAWAWRLHQAKGEVDVMDVLTKICDEFPVESWRYPTTDIHNFQLPTGDWQPILHDARRWRSYHETVIRSKIDMLSSTLREYEKGIADFDNNQNQQVTRYQQYQEEWEALTGKNWECRH